MVKGGRFSESADTSLLLPVLFFGPLILTQCSVRCDILYSMMALLLLVVLYLKL